MAQHAVSTGNMKHPSISDHPNPVNSFSTADTAERFEASLSGRVSEQSEAVTNKETLISNNPIKSLKFSGYHTQLHL